MAETTYHYTIPYTIPVTIFDDAELGIQPSPPEVIAFLPEACRRAGKIIANQPELWCKGAWHRRVDGVRQGCALGQIETVLDAHFGQPGVSWVLKVNQASRRAANDKSISEINDALDATPETVADHLYVVADELEFGDV